jgi:hypothetical protein
MGVISKETLDLIAVVRERYPKTWEWIRHKANLEHMCVGAIFKYWKSTIKAMMKEEKPNA